MIEQRFSARRCRDTRKPRENECPDVKFYRCMECGALFPVTGGKEEKEIQINCCGKAVEQLISADAREKENLIKVFYQIIGGFNDNAVKVAWKTDSPKNKPEWIYLKTFTGGYLKYIKDMKQSPVVFALADTDAFAYCDENPCLECVFRCKRGFIIYVYEKRAGLLELPLDKMNAHWQSAVKNKETFF